MHRSEFELDPVYYRVMRAGDNPNELVVACMQWFDEYDYDKSRYMTSKTFQTVRAARKWAKKQLKKWNSSLVLEEKN